MFNDNVRTPESNEDWQFENPIASGKITGRKPIEVPKLNLDSILPKPKEVTKVKFADLGLDKQVKLVADEYNGDLPIPAILLKLGVSKHEFYILRDKAMKAGLITELRGPGRRTVEEPAEATRSKSVPKETSRTVDPERVAGELETEALKKLEQAEKLAQEAKRLRKASEIALGIQDLLGEKAGDLVASLYEAVSA
jgi:hypothetical protein